MKKYFTDFLSALFLTSFFIFMPTKQIYAASRAPSIDEMSRVKSLAEQLKMDTDDAYVEAAKDAGPSK